MVKTSVEAPDTFTLWKKGTTKPIGPTVAYVETLSGQHKAILTPARNLRSGVTYTAKITSAATDVATRWLARSAGRSPSGKQCEEGQSPQLHKVTFTV